MRFTSRLLSLTMCLVLALTCCTVAYGADDVSWPEDTSPITLTCYTTASWGKVWGEDPISQKVTDLTGVSIDMRIPVKDETTETLSLMMASNDFPDMLMLSANNEAIPALIDEGFVMNVDKLMADYAPGLETIIRTYHGPELLDDFKAEDGNNYMLYFGYNTELCNDELKNMGLLYPVWLMTFVTRQDWLDEIGNPETNSPEAFKAALVAMKENHPDADGLIMDSLDSFMYQFGVWDNVGWGGQGLEDGKIVHQMRRDKYREAMKYAYDLASSGLLTKEGFMNPYDINNAKFLNGEAIAMRANYYAYTNNVTMGDTRQVSIEPFPTYGFAFQYYPWMAMAITTNCKAPDRAIRFLEYCASNEGQLMLGYGVEGDKDGYTGDLVNGPHFYFDSDIPCRFYEQGKPVAYPELQNERAVNFDAVAKQSGVTLHSFMQNWAINNWNIWEWSKTSDEFIAYTDMMEPHIYFKPEFTFTLEPDSPEGIAATKVNAIVEEYELKIVFAQSDEEFDALLNEMIEKSEQAGLESVEAEWTRQYYENIDQ